MHKRGLICLTVCAGISLALAADPPLPDFPRVPATPPDRATETFRAVGGFRMELLAAEPLVTDPVAMAYDENGRAFVAEMSDYPYTDAATHEPWKDNTTDAPIGRVRLLIDDDGDGAFDRSTLFAEGLSWPTGVACWKGGVFVAATPDVWYLKDTDGDGKADVRRKVFTGFRKFNVQAVMNNLVWGLDNCIYGAGGSNGGKIVPGEKPDAEPVTLTRHDFRFDPATERLEPIPGGARFGNTFDDWGNRFVCNIRNPAQHVLLETRYLARNPHLTIGSVVHDVAKAGDALPVYRISPLEAWRDVRANRLAAERSTQPRSELVAGGVVTSSSGITIYRGDAYPPEFRGQLFVGEVANNLVHRQAMRPNGVTFESNRIDEKVEFAASTDVWFRPVNFVNAPDGTLHVLDMYREVIEHPWSIPDDIRAKLDLRSGSDRGRIYRLAPPGFRPGKPPRLGDAKTAELVDALRNPNAWWRETAQRLIVERQDEGAVQPLRGLTNAKEPLARLHALWTLEGLAAVTEPDVVGAMGDAAPGVRENAIRVAERHLERSPALLEPLLRAAEDGDVRVRFQAALTLGESKDARVVDALAALARRDAADSWVTAAILSASAGRSAELMAKLVQGDGAFAAAAPGQTFLRQLAATVGAANVPAEVSRAAALLADHDAAAHSIAAGLGEGLRRRGRTLRSAADPSTPSGTALDALLATASRAAADAAIPAAERISALRLLAFDDFDRVSASLADLLDPRQPPEVQRAAVAALAGFNRADVAPVLLARWASYTPALRNDVVQAMLAYRNRLPALLGAVEAGRVRISDIPASRRVALTKDADEKIQGRAMKLFGTDGGGGGGRKQVIEQFAPALELAGDPTGGRKVYETLCASCHRLGDLGADVGPNLATVRQWGPQQLLVNILDPNREVAPAYAEYVLQLADGETLSGIVAEETGTSITLTMSGGVRRVLSRQGVKRINASQLSLMPEGLETGLTPQQMADLIALLRRAPAN